MKIISWKNFEALSINEKLNFVGHLIFTKNQITLLDELLHWDEVSTEQLSEDMGKSKRSISSTASSINRKYEDHSIYCYLIDIDQACWGNETFLQIDQDELNEWLDSAYDQYVADNNIEWPEDEEEVQASEEEEVQASEEEVQASEEEEVQASEEEVQAEEVQASEEEVQAEEVQAEEEVQASEEEEVQAEESKTIKRLKPSTIKRYTVEQIANHADDYQLAIDTDEYRFDFQFKSIYTKGGNQYYYYMDMLDTDFNKMMITSILSSIYQLHDIKIMEESIKQMKGA